MALVFLYFVCSLIVVMTTFASSSPSYEHCEKLGFRKENLLCSSCQKLDEYVKDQALYHECLECCTADLDDDQQEPQRFHSATLVLCKCILPHSPHLESFVTKEAANFANLQLQWVNGMQPVLELKNEDSRVVQSIGIAKWKTEHIVEFLNEKLRK